uniref:Uncharacterized protein n=1 Tax=Helianthus annuus TaxID=4232 RepID=A0A251TEQ0_HELAN
MLYMGAGIWIDYYQQLKQTLPSSQEHARQQETPPPCSQLIGLYALITSWVWVSNDKQVN